jgi:hypothetical protein
MKQLEREVQKHLASKGWIWEITEGESVAGIVVGAGEGDAMNKAVDWQYWYKRFKSFSPVFAILILLLSLVIHLGAGDIVVTFFFFMLSSTQYVGLLIVLRDEASSQPILLKKEETITR